MNTTTLASTVAARLPFALPHGLSSSLLQRLQRALQPAAADPAAWPLAAAVTAWIDRPLGRTITCESGTLWLTFDNEPTDVILEAGESHCCDKASKLAIHALATARVRVQ